MGITICDLQLSVSLRLDLVFNVIVPGLVFSFACFRGGAGFELQNQRFG